MTDQTIFQRTGEQSRTIAKSVVCRFDKYEVVVNVSEGGQLLGIQEIRVRKDFRAPSQIGYVDSADYYRE
jgi:hypothetical protein